MDDASGSRRDLPPATAASTETEASSASYSSLHASMGIERMVTESFLVGEYRYSKLEDAIAQARRSAK